MSANLLKQFIIQEISISDLEKTIPVEHDFNPERVYDFLSISTKNQSALKTRVDTLLANKKIKLIGRGTSRIAFALGSKRVLKLALDTSGIAQNHAEVEVFTNPKTKPIVAKIFNFAKDYTWLTMEPVRALHNSKEFEILAGFSLNVFQQLLTLLSQGESFTNAINVLKYEAQQGFYPANPSDLSFIETMATSELPQAVIELKKHSGIEFNDHAKLSHWGVTASRHLVTLDYGASGSVLDRFY